MSASKSQKTHAAVTGEGSAIKRYMTVMLGEQSVLKLLYFEFCMWLSPIPGMLGLALRKLFWPRLFAQCGKGTVFAAGVKLIQPARIHMGKRCVISENCVLDGRGTSGSVLQLGDDVMLSHGVVLSCKDGNISLGSRIGVGAYCVIQSTTDNPVTIGDDAVIGPQCYITGGGNYNIDRTDIPISQQGMRIMGGSTIEHGTWLGAKVTVLGGVTVGYDGIVAAGSTVTKTLPALSISLGSPAKVVKKREARTEQASQNEQDAQ